jgi:type IV secretory pathway TrbL component
VRLQIFQFITQHFIPISESSLFSLSSSFPPLLLFSSPLMLFFSSSSSSCSHLSPSSLSLSPLESPSHHQFSHVAMVLIVFYQILKSFKIKLSSLLESLSSSMPLQHLIIVSLEIILLAHQVVQYNLVSVHIFLQLIVHFKIIMQPSLGELV